VLEERKNVQKNIKSLFTALSESVLFMMCVFFFTKKRKKKKQNSTFFYLDQTNQFPLMIVQFHVD